MMDHWEMCVLLILLISTCIKCEVFTSSAEMERTHQLEKNLFKKLISYVATEEKRLQRMKDLMMSVNTSLNNRNLSTGDMEEVKGHPINSYRMLKRFDTGWNNLEEIISMKERTIMNISKMFNEAREGGLIPTKEDVEGAIDGLLRLQATYNLKSRSLANGILPGLQNANSLDINHLYEIGTRAYKTKEYRLSIQWFQLLLDKFGNHTMVEGVSKADVYDYLAAIFYETGDIKNAFELTKELVELRPRSVRVVENLKYLRHAVQSAHKLKEEYDTPTLKDISQSEIEKEAEEYAKLCRGESRSLSKRETRYLKCWYRAKNVLLYLKPQRVERLWVYPDILLFHDILLEKETHELKKLAYPRLQRAKVFYVHEMAQYQDNTRISKSAWLDTRKYPVVNSLRKRVQALTNLDMKFSEHLQIANYGVGGHFIPHYDHAHENRANFSYSKVEKRMATLLFYLSEIGAGGRTVFTSAGASIAPVKNSAVFWYNLKRNGQGDKQTKHAACPVLAGEKWVSNWWVHSDGQMLRRPCALNKKW